MRKHGRTIALVLVLAGCAVYYVLHDIGFATALSRLPGFQRPPVPLNGATAALPFDADTLANIRHYFDGVSVDARENNTGEAMHLDQAIGRPQLARGEYREAYRTYQKVLAISYQQGSLMGVGLALNVMANLAGRSNDLNEALFTNLLAYKVTVRMNNKEETGVVELSLARLLKDEDPALSMMWLLKAKEDLKDSGYREDLVRTLPSLARSLQQLGENAKASQVLAGAWVQAQALGDSESQRWAKTEVASAYADDLDQAGSHAKAIEVLQAALAVFSPDTKTSDTYTGILYRLARAHAGLKQDAQAAHEFLSAYANYELTRADAPGEAARAQLDKNHKAMVDDFVDFNLRSGDTAAALAILESNKARTLNDVFEDPSYRQVQDQWKEMERRQAREASDLLNRKENDLVPTDGRQTLANLMELSKKHDDERRHLQTTLQLKEMIATKSMAKADVEQMARTLPPDVAVMSYFVRDTHPGLFLVAQRRIRYVPLSGETAELRRSVQELRVALTNPHNDFYREPARRLFQAIAAPALKVIPRTVTVLVYSPDDLLSTLPLEALMDGEQFLGERFAVYRVPSLRYAGSVGAVRSAPVKRGIACVDPDIPGGRLPFQDETGRVLQKLYGGNVTPLMGKDCSESKLVAAIASLRQPTFLHVGAHGNFYPADAMESAIWLSPEGGDGAEPTAWNARAMATADMRQIALVTLSSCETGLLDPSLPRDTFGIARSLFFAGAKSIVAPLWAVDDQATADYMNSFHAAYARGVPAVLALQQAQGSLRRSERYRHPFYWAGFVLTGVVR